MSARALVACVVAGTALVGCHDSDRAAAPAPSTTTPQPTAVTTETTTTTTAALPVGPPCLPGNLQGHYEDYASAMNQPSYFFTLTNTGPRCTLHGYPGVQILDAAGHPAGNAVERGSGFVAHDPGPHDVTLNTGSKAWFAVASATICIQGTPPAAESSAVLIIPPNTNRQIKVPVQVSYCPQGRVSVSAVASARDAFYSR